MSSPEESYLPSTLFLLTDPKGEKLQLHNDMVIIQMDTKVAYSDLATVNRAESKKAINTYI